MKKVMIAMSGGVDSSVTCLIMMKKGFECAGSMMKLNSYTDTNDAKIVAEKLNIPFFEMNCVDEFRKNVVENFVKSYENGETPNPCVECNKFLKFGIFLDDAIKKGYDYIATGHYATVEFNGETNKYELKRAKDLQKDQSYFLYNLTQYELSHIKFPLGEFSKSLIREIALSNNFVNAKKKDSQDICFIPDGDYGKFIEEYRNTTFKKGEFIHKNGEVLGKHNGIIHYTIGQRKGLGIAYKNPLYVCKIDGENNNIILGDNEDLFTKTVRADNVNIISGELFKEPKRVMAKVRYRHIPQMATAFCDDNGILNIEFDEPQRAVTKGQSAVIYDGDTVLGGGIII